ncbi:MAG: hypothetical protein V3W20_15040 [Candidatus Neomarinimicrobiota bacterium]
MSEKLIGILYKDEQKVFGKKVDALIDFRKFGKKGWMKIAMKILEAKDDDIFSGLIGFLDNTYGNRIPVDLKPAARGVALSVINDDYEAFKVDAPKLLNLIIDIKKMSEETEAVIISALIVGIVDALELTLKK